MGIRTSNLTFYRAHREFMGHWSKWPRDNCILKSGIHWKLVWFNYFSMEASQSTSPVTFLFLSWRSVTTLSAYWKLDCEPWLRKWCALDCLPELPLLGLSYFWSSLMSFCNGFPRVTGTGSIPIHDMVGLAVTTIGLVGTPNIHIGPLIGPGTWDLSLSLLKRLPWHISIENAP